MKQNIKKLIIIYLLIFIILHPLKSIEKEIKNEFQIANSHYSKKDFDKALKKYKFILEQGYDNFQINYNIGCCYYKLNKYGFARFYFERALFHKPYDEDLFHNLNIVYKNILKNPEIGKQVIMNRRVIFFIPSPILVFLLLFFIILTIFFFVLLYFLSDKRRLLLILLSISFVFTLIFTILFFTQFNEYNKKIFILTEQNANVYITPDEFETILATLKEGSRGIITDEIDEYIKIKLNDGSNGWIKKDSVIFKP